MYAVPLTCSLCERPATGVAVWTYQRDYNTGKTYGKVFDEAYCKIHRDSWSSSASQYEAAHPGDLLYLMEDL